MTKKEIEKFSIKEKLETCERILHTIELTNDKSSRLRWRVLSKIVKHYKSILKQFN